MKAVHYIVLWAGIMAGCASNVSNQPLIKIEPGAVEEPVAAAENQMAPVTPAALAGTWICTQSLELFYFTPQTELQVYAWEGKINNDHWEQSELTYKQVAYKSHRLTYDGSAYVNDDPANPYKAVATRVADDIIQWNDGLYLDVKLIKIDVEKEVYADKTWNPFTFDGLKEKVRANK